MRLSRTVAFGAAAYIFFVNMLGTTLPTPLYPIYHRRFGFSELMITVIFATYSVAVIGSLLVFGRLSDDAGRRPVLLLGLGFSALSAGAFLLAGGLVFVLVGRLLSGMSAGIFTGSATAAVVDLSPNGQRELATRVAVAVNVGGLATGTLISGLLAQYAPYPLHLAFWSDLGLLAPAFIGLFLLPETVERTGAGFRFQRLSVPDEVREIFVPALIAGFCAFAVSGVFSAVSPEFLVKALHLDSHALTGAIVFFLFAASAAGQALVPRLDTRTALPAGAAILLLGVLLLAAAILLSSLAFLVASAGVSGLGQGLVIGAGLAAINERAPAERRSEVDSTYFVGLYVGLALPVVGVGLATQAFGLPPAGVAFSAITALVVAVVMVVLFRQRHRSHA
jgi:MFS family permease